MEHYMITENNSLQGIENVYKNDHILGHKKLKLKGQET